MECFSLVNDDVMNVLRKMDDNSIDCVITDPPYFFDTLDSDWSLSKHQRRKSNSHIKNIPMGMKFDKEQGKNFYEFMLIVSKELYRVLKPGGFYMCFSSPRMYHNLASAIEDSGFDIRDQICWKFNTSQVKAFKQDHIIDRDKALTDEEKNILKDRLKNYKTPQLKPLFEPICVSMKPIEGRFIDNFAKWNTGLMYVSPDEKFPTNVMEFNKPSKGEKMGLTHPTMKPVELLKKLIDIFCPKDGVVLDPFMGSGSTGVACLDRKRIFKGIDINNEYVEMSKNRMCNYVYDLV